MWAAVPPTRSPLSRLGDRDLVRDADDAIEACDVVKGRVALELIADVTCQGDPAVVDLDVNQVGRDLRVPDQGL